MGAYTAYPYSRGKIHITDKEDVLNGYTCISPILLLVLGSILEISEPGSITGLSELHWDPGFSAVESSLCIENIFMLILL